MKTIALATVALTALLAPEARAWWAIELSKFRCEAAWIEDNDWRLRLVADADTYARRLDRHPDLDPAKPVLQWNHFITRHTMPPYGEWALGSNACRNASSSDPPTGACDLPWNDDETTVELDARVFPDDGAGFFPVVLHALSEWGYGGHLEWTGFDLHDRLGEWGDARESKDLPAVRLPEIRLIFHWSKRAEVHFEPPDDAVDKWISDVMTEYYVDFPLWRLSNIMNKLERCGEDLITEF